jgi:hypothetical protein
MRAIAIVFGLSVATLSLMSGGAPTGEKTSAPTPAGTSTVQPGSAVTAWAPAVEPKPLSQNVKRGIGWLVEHQDKTGGWGQGEESAGMGTAMAGLIDKPNVGDTCAAALALIRAGSTPAKGDYAANVRRAVEFVCREIKAAEEPTLYVTSVRGTRLQLKLGTYVDTFLASMLLAEVKGNMPDQVGEKLVADALNKVMDKIEKNQKADGTFGETGWANTLSAAMASKGYNRVAQVGGPVNEAVRERLEGYARAQFDAKSGQFSAAGSAGVGLYSAAGNLGAMQDSANTNETKRAELEHKVNNGSTREEKEKARSELKRYEDNRNDLEAAQKAVLARLSDPQFIAGFGSNGGEEFLSYMNIGESLVVTGGENWRKWDQDITANLNRIQNKDGSWTGHHCITGRTFCTAAALLVLTTDRAPVPVAAKIRKS